MLIISLKTLSISLKMLGVSLEIPRVSGCNARYYFCNAEHYYCKTFLVANIWLRVHFGSRVHYDLSFSAKFVYIAKYQLVVV